MKVIKQLQYWLIVEITFPIIGLFIYRSSSGSLVPSANELMAFSALMLFLAGAKTQKEVTVEQNEQLQNSIIEPMWSWTLLIASVIMLAFIRSDEVNMSGAVIAAFACIMLSGLNELVLATFSEKGQQEDHQTILENMLWQTRYELLQQTAPELREKLIQEFLDDYIKRNQE